MGLNYFIFNGRSSLDFGVYIGGQATFNAPQRDISKISISGRNGDLIRDNGRFLNIEVTYNVVIMKEFREKTAEIRAWLKSATSYARLEDTYNPDYYRMGVCTGSIEFDTLAFNEAGKAQITFDCKPQRFLKEGENTISLGSLTSLGTDIYNPTEFPSKPLIRVYASGTVIMSVGKSSKRYEMTIADISEYIDIDCDLMDCYKGALNQNSKVTLQDGFPQLESGINDVALGEGSAEASVDIIPRWWTV